MSAVPYTSTHSLIPGVPFDFHSTVTSHGWYALKPNDWNKETSVFSRIEQLSDGTVVYWRAYQVAESRQSELRITIDSDLELSADQYKEVLQYIRYMLRMDEDLNDFYERCIVAGGRWGELIGGAGRLLRSPSLFEDLVKTICTTNIHWSGTIRMVEGLVDALGRPAPWDQSAKSFPTASAIAAADATVFEGSVKLGYRAAYIQEIARAIETGDLNLEAFRHSDLATTELRKELLALKGVGKYAAAVLLMFLERYDDLAVDSVFRDFVGNTYFTGRKASDAEMRAVYSDWDEWKFLAFWFDMWGGK